jgi:hypothetical protein
MPLFWIRHPAEKKPGYQLVYSVSWIWIRTGIDGCPVPEHTDLTEASIGCHTTHMIHGDDLDEELK